MIRQPEPLSERSCVKRDIRKSRRDRFDLTFSTRFARYFKAYLNLSSSHKYYNAQFFHDPSDSLTEGRFTIAELKLRFAYNEKFLSTPQGIRSLGTLYPIVWISYQHAFPNLFGGEFKYDRFKFEVSKYFYTHYLGVAKVMLQAGYAAESCPVMETCAALREGKVAQLPVKQRTLKVKERRLTYIYIRYKGMTAIHRRPPGDIWQGLYEPLLTVSVPYGAILLRQNVKHVLTHRVLYADFYLWEPNERPELPDGYFWIPEQAIDQYGVPRLIEILLEQLHQ